MKDIYFNLPMRRHPMRAARPAGMLALMALLIMMQFAPIGAKADKVAAFCFGSDKTLTFDAVESSEITKFNAGSKISADKWYDISAYDDAMACGSSGIRQNEIRYTEKVVINSDFAEYTTRTNMDKTFYYLEDLTRITGLQYFLPTGKSATNCSYMFGLCKKLDSLDLTGFKTDEATSMEAMFYACNSLTSLDASGLNTSSATNMNGMFLYCYALSTLKLSTSFKTDKVTDMGDMFRSCSNLKEIDLSGFSTANVLRMSRMFEKCTRLTSLDLSSFDTRRVRYMNSMFSGCYNLNKIDVSKLRGDSVRFAQEMFSGCSKLTEINLSNFSTPRLAPPRLVAYEGSDDIQDGGLVYSMFSSCSNVTYIDISKMDFTNVTNVTNMFYNCSKLKVLQMGKGNDKFNTALQHDNVFYGVGIPTDPVSLVPTNDFVTSALGERISVASGKRPYYYSWLGGCIYVTGNTPVVKLATAKDGTRSLTFTMGFGSDITDATNGADGVYALNSSTINQRFGLSTTEPGWISTISADNEKITSVAFDYPFAAARPTATRRWFDGLSNLKDIYQIENLNTEEVLDMSYMFNNCRSLTSVSVAGFNTRKVRSMSLMFHYCVSLENIYGTDAADFVDTANRDIYGMFSMCRALRSLSLPGFTTQYCPSLAYLFSGCSSLDSLNIKKFNTANATNTSSMFRGCSSLNYIVLGNTFNTEKVTNASYMFSGCTNLKAIVLPTRVPARATIKPSLAMPLATTLRAMFAGCESMDSENLLRRLSLLKAASATDIRELVDQCATLTTFDFPSLGLDAAKLTTGEMNAMFNSAILPANNFSDKTNIRQLNMGNYDFCDMDATNNMDVFRGVGTPEIPCQLIVGEEFDKSVLGALKNNGVCDYYVWRGGYFTFDDNIGIHNALVGSDGADNDSDGAWYTTSGIRLHSQPTTPGIYIHGRRTVVIK